MKGRRRNAIVGVVVVLGFLVSANVVTAQEPEVDFKAVAERLVNQSAAVQEGDVVLIRGTTGNMELLEHTAVQVRKRGAFPLLTLTTDDLVRRMYEEVPAKYDAQDPTLGLKLANIVDAIITVTAEENPNLLAKVPAERIAARNKTFEAVYKAMLSRNIRMVGLGNALYPTEATARQHGMSRSELATIFWNGVNVDQAELEQIGDTLKTYLAAGKEVRITRENGTDLRMRIEHRPVHVSDGVISSEDIRTGGAACQVWLPAGEVFLAPVPGTAEGTVVIDRHFFRGQEIRGLRMTFKGGKMSSMTAASGLEPLKKLYDSCGGDKDEFAAIDIGINPNVRIPPNSRLVAWMASGMISVGVGSNIWAGGTNASEFGLYVHLPGGTLTVDGRELIENGALQP
ncbi:MAG: aminopeptidase [bacterium]|nr:aminopeptidase [bacterium]